MLQIPPRSTRNATLVSYTTLFRSSRATRLPSTLLGDEHVAAAILGDLGRLVALGKIVADLDPDEPVAVIILGGVHLVAVRSEEHTSELQSLMRISYAVFCLKKKKHTNKHHNTKKDKLQLAQT